MTSTSTPLATSAANNGSSSVWVPPANGIVGGYTDDNPNIIRALTAFTAIAWYNAAELIFLVFLRFKKKSGLYFWSMLITSISIIVYQFGAWGKMVNISNKKLFSLTFMNVGWIFMISGQSVVLYSRLHLITQSRLILRTVLWVIIFNTVVLYIPTTMLNYAAILHPRNNVYVNGYEIMERIQMTIFTIQELAISVIYLHEVAKFLRITYEDQTRKLMYELLAVNIMLILLDVALLSVEYENLYEIETTLKGLVYSVKLKLELGVLSKLVKVVTARQNSYMITAPDQDTDMKRFASADTQRNILEPQRTATSESRSRSNRRSSGHRTSDETQASNTNITDFAVAHSGVPLAGPSDEESAAAQAYLHDAHHKHSETSSLADLYPGKLDS